MNDNQEVIGTLEDIKYLLQKPKNIEIARVMIDSMITYLNSRQANETQCRRSQLPMNRSNNKSCLPVIEDPATMGCVVQRMLPDSYRNLLESQKEPHKNRRKQ